MHWDGYQEAKERSLARQTAESQCCDTLWFEEAMQKVIFQMKGSQEYFHSFTWLCKFPLGGVCFLFSFLVQPEQ